MASGNLPVKQTPQTYFPVHYRAKCAPWQGIEFELGSRRTRPARATSNLRHLSLPGVTAPFAIAVLRVCLRIETLELEEPGGVLPGGDRAASALRADCGFAPSGCGVGGTNMAVEVVRGVRQGIVS